MAVTGGRGRVGGGTEGDEQRGEMLHRGVRVRHAGCAGTEAGEFVDIAAGQRVRRPGVEVRGPARHLVGVAPVEERKAVGHVTRADHQDPGLAQRPQPPAQVQQPRGVVGRHAELQDRNPGIGVHDLQRHPRAVVQAAAGVLVYWLGAGHELGDLFGERGGVRRVVPHLVVHRVEAAEVIDELAWPAAAEGKRSRLPVRGDDEDGPRPGQGPCPGVELGHPARHLEQHRGSVAEVQAGQRPVVRGPQAVGGRPLGGGGAAQVRGERVVGSNAAVGGCGSAGDWRHHGGRPGRSCGLLLGGSGGAVRE
jgi:hypothetical protein